MSGEHWYVHIQGETFGPVPTEVVSIMLRQNRLQFSDYVWTEGLTKWMRIGDLHQFATFLPPYPGVPIPPLSGSAPHLSSHAHAAATAAPAQAAPPAPAPSAPPPPAQAQSPALYTPQPAARPPQGAPASTVTGAIRHQPRAESPLKAWIRRYGRARILATAVVDGHGNFEVVDISEGGVFIKAATPIPFGTDLRFRLESGHFSKALEMTGIVIREGTSEDGQLGFAIQYTRVNPAHRRVIHEYVKSKLSSVE